MTTNLQKVEIIKQKFQEKTKNHETNRLLVFSDKNNKFLLNYSRKTWFFRDEGLYFFCETMYWKPPLHCCVACDEKNISINQLLWQIWGTFVNLFVLFEKVYFSDIFNTLVGKLFHIFYMKKATVKHLFSSTNFETHMTLNSVF